MTGHATNSASVSLRCMSAMPWGSVIENDDDEDDDDDGDDDGDGDEAGDGDGDVGFWLVPSSADGGGDDIFFFTLPALFF